MTDFNAAPTAGWIFFDADCRFCVAGRRRWGRVLERRGFAWLPLQSPGAAARLGVPEARLLDELRVLTADGRPLGGLDAVLALMRRVWWLLPLAWLFGHPALRPLAAAAYRRLARHRHCLGGHCRIALKGATP
jgi:predicted DCC family thiol-disulfide oxidoreductase YuxK